MFGSAVNMSGFNVSSFAADGILGMGFQSLSQLKTPPVIQSLVAQGVVPNAVFGLYMAESNNSELVLGGVNEELYTGEITYVPVDQKVRT
jgi:cathepsin D